MRCSDPNYCRACNPQNQEPRLHGWITVADAKALMVELEKFIEKYDTEGKDANL